MPKYNHPRQKLSRMVTLKLVKNLKLWRRLSGRTAVSEVIILVIQETGGGPKSTRALRPGFASVMLNEELKYVLYEYFSRVQVYLFTNVLTHLPFLYLKIFT